MVRDEQLLRNAERIQDQLTNPEHIPCERLTAAMVEIAVGSEKLADFLRKEVPRAIDTAIEV